MQDLMVGMAAAACITAAAQADIVTVIATGQVAFNSITDAPLGAVGAGDSVMVTFQVDSNVFLDGVPGDTRGYEIIKPSFSVSFGSGTSVGLQDPFPDGVTPYFTLVEGFPVSDGFFVSTSPISPGGVPLSHMPYQFNLDLGYVGATLATLDITDAYRDYAFGGLTRFSMDIWQSSPDNVRMAMDFSQLSIVPAPAGGAVLMVGGLGLAARRRR